MATPIHDNILSCIGATPLVRLDKIAKEEGFKCNLLAKLEYFNPGGSVKDRIALRMVTEAEESGLLIPGKSVIIEPSSGNTGIGLALVAAVKGYRCIITMPEKMSLEKANTLKALGAEVVRTPTEAAHDSPFSNIGVAKTLASQIPHAVILNQYDNPNNPDAHYATTASEIISSLSLPTTPASSSSPSRPSSGVVDVFVAGAGTGGTITGISRKLKEANPKTLVVGVDPTGSLLARPVELNVLKAGEEEWYKIEGIGYDFIPGVLSHLSIDHWIKSTDVPSFATVRRLMRTEGLLVGGSAGSALCGVVDFLKGTQEGRVIAGTEGKNVVVLFADSIRNYITAGWVGEQGVEGVEREVEKLKV